MVVIAREVLPVNLEDEMRQSYLDYAMSVIVGRALPDVRDGLKPVHRRVLFAMRELGNDWNKAYKKSARVVGDVIGKYHPHGDTAVYDTIVRMAQPFSMRYMLVDGQGNFGSVDGDLPAAMRYTEVRMSRIAHELLADIEKETVDFVPNYDESESEPSVMPTRVPNLLVNGAAGIAVGMATNIPPHNLTEIVNACLALIDDPDITLAALMQIVPGPDFPTGGIINGAQEIATAYRSGRGRLSVRARTHFEEVGKGDRQAIIVTELPYQVNKARLIERIADLVREKQIEGIAQDGLRDESDKDGMRVVLEVRRDAMAEVLLNNLFQQTQLQVTFGINMVALLDGQPRTLGLREILEAFVRHRREVVTRRTLFELRRARARAHILEGLTVALANIDEMIELIRSSASPEEARQRIVAQRWNPGLVATLLAAAGADASRPDGLLPSEGLQEDGYQMSEIQAKEILDMRLNRLTGLEQEKLSDEYRELLGQIIDLIAILESPERLLQVIRDELVALREEFGDARRTVIQPNQEDLNILDLIEPEDVVVTLSHAGYAKRQPVGTYRAQRRGGRGRSATSMKQEDFIDRLWIANTHDTLLTFTSAGRVYWLKVYQLPDASPQARGRPIVNLLPLEEDEQVQAVVPVREFDSEHFVFFTTRMGRVKKTPLSEFAFQLQRGKIAISLNEGDALVDAQLTDGSRDIMLFASNGLGVRFEESGVRSMGRGAAGVRGMRLLDDATVVSMIVNDGEGDILTTTANGYGKRTAVEEHPVRSRGTQGVIAIRCSERNGALVEAVQLGEDDELMLISNQGTLVRTRAAEVAKVSRNTQGVMLIRLPKDEALVGAVRIPPLESEEGDDDPEATEPALDGDAPAPPAIDSPVGVDSDAPGGDADDA